MLITQKILIIYLALNFFDIDIDNQGGPPKKIQKITYPAILF
jgi:hypothetical protein